LSALKVGIFGGFPRKFVRPRRLNVPRGFCSGLGPVGARDKAASIRRNF
jgi:hypothetical protein